MAKIKFFGSGALKGKMLDLGLLKISLVCVFPIFSAYGRGRGVEPNLGGTVLITFLNLRGKANLYLT